MTTRMHFAAFTLKYISINKKNSGMKENRTLFIKYSAINPVDHKNLTKCYMIIQFMHILHRCDTNVFS